MTSTTLPGAESAARRPALAAVPARLEKPAFLGERARSPRVSNVVRAVVPFLLVLAWWWTTRGGAAPDAVLAAPGDVWNALVELHATGQLGAFLGASLRRAGLGVGLGATAGLSLGVLSGLSTLGEELVDPTMQMLRAVPFLALVPIFISWFGIDEKFKVLLIATASAFPMYAYTYLGVRSVDRKIVEAARSFGLRGWSLLFQVILPGAMPSVLMALRICLAVSVIALIGAEQVGTTEGIGYLVLLAKQYYRQDYMILCISLYAVLGILFDVLIRMLERYTMPWRHAKVRR